jgi:hypothetical protein
MIPRTWRASAFVVDKANYVDLLSELVDVMGKRCTRNWENGLEGWAGEPVFLCSSETSYLDAQSYVSTHSIPIVYIAYIR